MSAKKVFFATLFGVCWSISSLQAQGPYNSGNQPAPTPRDTPVAASEATDTGGTGLSSWITYDRGDCCSGHGGGMPIYTEAAVRTGASIPVGGEYFSRNLDTGWTIEGSVRALFFNHEYTRAWTVELGMTNTYNPSHTGNKIFLDHTVNQFVTLVSLNRTFVTLALGGEWYLWAPANSDDARVRVGADIGGRWGSANAQFVEHPHSTDVIEGASQPPYRSGNPDGRPLDLPGWPTRRIWLHVQQLLRPGPRRCPGHVAHDQSGSTVLRGMIFTPKVLHHRLPKRRFKPFRVWGLSTLRSQGAASPTAMIFLHRRCYIPKPRVAKRTLGPRPRPRFLHRRCYITVCRHG